MRVVLLLLSLLYTDLVFSSSVYLSNEDFLKQTFSSHIPKAKVLWQTKSLKPSIKKILGHLYESLRIRYWDDGKKTAWILEEIGKEKMITVGIVVKNSQIDKITILVFRESRGWEIRHRFFTQQFYQAQLQPDLQLSKPIDGISGATLSVRAVTKLAKLALFLDQQLREHE